MSEQNGGKREVLEGYVVDQACLRKYPQDELLERSRVHTTECALMGHCMESGYGLVNEEDRPTAAPRTSRDAPGGGIPAEHGA